MKKVILLAAFNLVVYSGFAQSINPSTNDSTRRSFLNDHKQNKLIPFDNKTLFFIQDSLLNSQRFVKPENSTHMINSYNDINGFQFYDNMPCLKPQGSFPMKIFKPDSSSRYTLIIKKL